MVWEGVKFWKVEEGGDWRIQRKEKYKELRRCEEEIGFGYSEARPQCNGCGQAQGNEKVLQLWRNRSSRCKVLQTEEREKKWNKDCRRSEGGFFNRQKVSTSSPVLINSEFRLPDNVMKNFLDYFSTRNYKTNKGYSVEWITRKTQWSNEEEAIGILKV